MLEVLLDINADSKITANQNLYNFVNIFIYSSDHYYDLIFPEFLAKNNPDKCKKVLEDLELWINDSFTHQLPPLYQYALFYMIETWLEWEEDEPTILENDYTIDENDITDDEWVNNYPNDLGLLKTLFFNDLDFLSIGELYEAFKKSSKEFQEIYYLYLNDYKDLMPQDIRKEFEVIKSSICSNTLHQNDENLLSINTEEDFLNTINKVIDQFRCLIVEQGSYKLLWNDNSSHKKEEASQLLLKIFAEPRLKQADIDISREVETGRGPVDFKLSHGYKYRLLIEVKLASNTAFWHGLEKQLIQYMISEKVNSAIFLIIIYEEKELKLLDNINDVVLNLNNTYNLKITVKYINAIKNKPSASKLSKDHKFEIYN